MAQDIFKTIVGIALIRIVINRSAINYQITAPHLVGSIYGSGETDFAAQVRAGPMDAVSAFSVAQHLNARLKAEGFVELFQAGRRASGTV